MKSFIEALCSLLKSCQVEKKLSICKKLSSHVKSSCSAVHDIGELRRGGRGGEVRGREGREGEVMGKKVVKLKRSCHVMSLTPNNIQFLKNETEHNKTEFHVSQNVSKVSSFKGRHNKS
jgi:hypothetical protein